MLHVWDAPLARATKDLDFSVASTTRSRTSTDYPTKNRGGKGVIAIKTSARNGPVAAVRIVTDDDHVLLISDG